MKNVYIVNEIEMDPALVADLSYVSWHDSGLGYGRKAIMLHTEGVCIQDGIDAVLAAYPDAKVTANRSEAHRWLAGRDWGGARQGSGRKPLAADEPTVEGTISLPSSLDAKAKRLGGGNRSGGIRRALESIAE